MTNKKPNILFIFTDDQRFDTIKALGNNEILTPNLDKLVFSGTSFTQAHIPCGTSGAVCMPSRAMLHTGRTLFHLKGEGQSIPTEHKTMGEAFQNAGYNCYGTGKWHNGADAYARSFNMGDEIYFGGMADHWNVPSNDFDPTGKYEQEFPVMMNPKLSRDMMMVRSNRLTRGKHSTDLFCDCTKSFIENYESDKPFFCYVSLMAPHDPRTMPEKWKKMYDPKEVSLPENYKPEHHFDMGVRDIRDECLANYPRGEDEVREHLAEYYGMISHLDDAVGQIISSLKDKRVLDNTIIVFAGDNGLAVGQHGLFGKQNHYEHSIRVPLIFSGPNIPQGEKRDTYAYLLDIFPTLCEMTGTECPNSVEGNSLVKSIESSEYKNREDLFFAYTDMMRSVKKDPFKLINAIHDGTRFVQLFDLKNDPLELKNLASDDAHADTLKSLEAKLFEYKANWEDNGHRMSNKFWSDYETAPVQNP